MVVKRSWVPDTLWYHVEHQVWAQVDEATGVAQRLRPSERFGRTVLDAMRDAVAHGARLYACTDALHAQGLDRAALIPECAGHGGAVQFMARATSRGWRTLVF